MAGNTGQQAYNDPLGGVESSVGSQIRTDVYHKAALVEAAKDQYFSPLSGVSNMPKHMGKKMKKFHYLPLLDDRNINDQGIDAAGATSGFFKQFDLLIPFGIDLGGNQYNMEVGELTGGGKAIALPIRGVGSTQALADADADLRLEDLFKEQQLFDTDNATTITALEALTPAWEFTTTSGAAPIGGNLYGSSKDVGTIQGKLPTLSETGGRVNRVGFKRFEVEGTFEKFGFFDEYTEDSLNFDSDAELLMHINKEMVKGANEINEDLIQIDLLNSAGVVRYGGEATSTGALTGETGSVASEVSYLGLIKLGISLDNNNSPRRLKILTGTRMIDTKVVEGVRVLYIGSELIPQLRGLVDLHGAPAFIHIAKYASGGKVLRGEIGAVADFRIVVVPEMMHWAGAGAPVVNNDGYMETDGNYDVFPMLTVGSGAYTTIGFQTSGKKVKFKIKHSKPGSPESYANDPFGETGFMSIKWFYGMLLERPERIGLYKVVTTW